MQFYITLANKGWQIILVLRQLKFKNEPNNRDAISKNIAFDDLKCYYYSCTDLLIIMRDDLYETTMLYLWQNYKI